jgi:hypothetical protein
MATHDYVIDNQTAPNFRADLNNALQAIVSTNSNATSPTTTYAGMMWYDTANDLLRMRNEGNDGWITLGTLDQVGDTFAANVAIASQAEAEAGTNTTKLMTPQRVAQAISKLAVNDYVWSAVTATTSGTAFDFAGLPAGIQEIVVALDGVSFSANDDLLIQLGTSGGLVTSGYVGRADATTSTSPNSFTTGFGARLAATSGTSPIKITRVNANKWFSNHVLARGAGVAMAAGAGRVDLGAEVTQLRVTRTGSATFNAGSIQVGYR